MKTKTIVINKIASVNANSLNSNHNYKIIKYLDTGNITNNKIDTIQEFNLEKDKIPSRARRLVKNKSIIYSTVRPNQRHFGFLENPDQNLVVSTGFATLDITDSTIDPKYLYYYLTQPFLTEYLHSIAENAVTSYPSIRPDDIAGLRIKLPNNVEDQILVTKVLTALDAKIELNNRINGELEAMAKTIYDYWFVQFDFPISADIAASMGKPELEGKPYKSSGGKMVWSEELKREIPYGWEVKKIAELIAGDKNGDWGKDEITGNYTQEVFCIRGADINGLNGKEQCNPPIRFVLEKNVNKLLRPYDLIVEISGGSPTQSTGRIAHISKTMAKRFQNPLICSNFCKALTLKDYKLTYSFKHFWNRLYDNNVFFGYEGKTSGIKNLLFNNFVNTNYMIIPHVQIKDTFFGFMENTEKKRQKALEENQKLTDLRDWLLPMLMNGQVKVSD